MYRLGHRTHHAHLFIYVLVLVALLSAGGMALRQYLSHSDTVITQAAPVVTEVKNPTAANKTFDEGIFSLKLPADWKYLGRDRTTIYHPYQWENTTNNPGSRVLAVYVDNIPADMAVNRLLPVDVVGGRLNPGTVSDNCTTFSGNSNTLPANNIKAKWSGVSFTCDMRNYERDVVGTGSVDGINAVHLTGSTAGAHTFFFTYTDNTDQPDYSIFTDTVSSFVVK